MESFRGITADAAIVVLRLAVALGDLGRQIGAFDKFLGNAKADANVSDQYGSHFGAQRDVYSRSEPACTVWALAPGPWTGRFCISAREL